MPIYFVIGTIVALVMYLVWQQIAKRPSLSLEEEMKENAEAFRGMNDEEYREYFKTKIMGMEKNNA